MPDREKTIKALGLIKNGYARFPEAQTAVENAIELLRDDERQMNHGKECYEQIEAEHKAVMKSWKEVKAFIIDTAMSNAGPDGDSDLCKALLYFSHEMDKQEETWK